MNRRLCVWVVSIFTCVALVGTAIAQVPPATPGGAPGAVPAPAAAPVPAGPTIPPAAETAPDANSFAPGIRLFIQFQLNTLGGSDFAAQSNARDLLR